MNTLNIPNLLSTPDIRVSYTINNQSYMFHFLWSDTFCLLDIYIIQDNENVYICKGEPLIPERNLIARSAEMQGALVLVNKYGQQMPPSQNNLSSDFVLVYATQEEING